METEWESRGLVSATNLLMEVLKPLGAIFPTWIKFWLLLTAAKQWYQDYWRSDNQRGGVLHASFIITWIWENSIFVFLNRKAALPESRCCWNISPWKSMMETSPAKAGLATYTCRNTCSLMSSSCKSTRGGVKCFLWHSLLWHFGGCRAASFPTVRVISIEALLLNSCTRGLRFWQKKKNRYSKPRCWSSRFLR